MKVTCRKFYIIFSEQTDGSSGIAKGGNPVKTL